MYVCAMAEVAVYESNGRVSEATERHGIHRQGPGRRAEVCMYICTMYLMYCMYVCIKPLLRIFICYCMYDINQ